jgi:hypothetical protein
MKPITFLVAFLLVLIAQPFVMIGGARPVYNAIMTYQYKLREDKDLRDTCQYCHIQAEGGEGWNLFGTLMQEVFSEEGKRRVPETLYETLKRNADSDRDGYRDVLEVVAKTFPGNKNSVPTKTVKELEAELEKLGGVDAFKPIVPRQ